MEISKFSIRIRNFLKQEYGEEEKVLDVLELFREEGKSIILAFGVNYDKKYDVFLDLYAEYKIYSGLGDEKIASVKLENFNKLIKNLSQTVNIKKEKEKETKKGLVIVND